VIDAVPAVVAHRTSMKRSRRRHSGRRGFFQEPSQLQAMQ
jgi:hypothetical protein